MTPEAYRRAGEVYGLAAALGGADREAAIARECAGDAALEAVVRSMLRADEAAPGFLDPGDPGLGRLAAEAVRERAGVALPERVGGYRVLSRLGVGGMGVVYEAEQEHPRRRVALKVVRPGLLAPSLLARFRREVEIAGRLHHPGIAHIHEAGFDRTAAGEETPFFSMELVRGPRIDAYCRDHGPAPRGTVELFLRVCDAVAYAHANGVVHRDLKPGNILVDLSDPAAPTPKVLDFGVARLADQTGGTLATETGHLVGTLAYMSPEQVAGRTADARADVYSLGVVLFELLAGRSPYPSVPSTVAEAVRLVCDTEVTRLGSAAPALRGDLETILTKALERDPARRYTGVAELAADLRRFLRDEPIAARPPSTWYQARKFAKRNRVLVAALSASFVCLAAGLAASTVLWSRAAAARDQAAREARALTVVRDFLRRDLMGAASPDILGASATVLGALDRAVPVIDARFASEPRYAGLLHLEVGSAYSQLGVDDKARPELTRAVELLSGALPPAAPALLEARAAAAELGAAAGDLEGSERTLREVVALSRGSAGPDAERTLVLETQLGAVLHMRDRYDESEALLRSVASRQLRAFGPDYLPRYQALNQLGAALAAHGKFEEGYAVALEVQQAHDRLLPDHPDTVAALNELATMCLRLDRLEEYAAYMRRAGELADRVLPKDSMLRGVVLGSYASSLIRQGRPAEAEGPCEESLRIMRDRLGPGSFQTYLCVERLAAAHAAMGHVERAREIAATLGTDGDPALRIRMRLRVWPHLARSGNAAEARSWLEEARRIAAAAHGESSPSVASVELEQAAMLADEGRKDEARALLEAALARAKGDEGVTGKIRRKLDALDGPPQQPSSKAPTKSS